MAVIDATSFYIEAFFRETFVGNFKKGDRAVVTLMSYPNTPLEGKIDSIGRGIAQQNGSTGFQFVALRSPNLRMDPTRAAHTGYCPHRKRSREHRTTRWHHCLGGGHDRDEQWW
jgi:hypothetical protein